MLSLCPCREPLWTETLAQTKVSAMSVLEHAAAIVKKYEGCKLEAYKCPADVWTVGVGHTGSDVCEGLKWTQAQADAALNKDLLRALNDARKVIDVGLNDKQMAAIVSFVFNLGIGNFRNSTLLKKINKGDFLGASKEFLKWTYGGGRQLPGLVARREAEAKLFMEHV